MLLLMLFKGRRSKVKYFIKPCRYHFGHKFWCTCLLAYYLWLLCSVACLLACFFPHIFHMTQYTTAPENVELYCFSSPDQSPPGVEGGVGHTIKTTPECARQPNPFGEQEACMCRRQILRSLGQKQRSECSVQSLGFVVLCGHPFLRVCTHLRYGIGEQKEGVIPPCLAERPNQGSRFLHNCCWKPGPHPKPASDILWYLTLRRWSICFGGHGAASECSILVGLHPFMQGLCCRIEHDLWSNHQQSVAVQLFSQDGGMSHPQQPSQCNEERLKVCRA